MITIVLTYRNRDLNVLKKCLNSLVNQTHNDFSVVLVNYGSTDKYTSAVSEIVKDFSFLIVINCQTQGQLWCKSRAINIALKQCQTPYFIVGDIDMMYHQDFIKTANNLQKTDDVTYFQVGFLSQKESKRDKLFEDYEISFKSSEGATGMTLYKTEVLKSINGYDEFYNGWGSEDTDVHIRLRNSGYKVRFYNDKILMLHQWHAKHYRTKESLAPFHSTLEQINAEYLAYSKKTKRTKANMNFEWGIYDEKDYLVLKTIDEQFELYNSEAEIKAFINTVLLTTEDRVIGIKIKQHKDYKTLKQKVKKVIGKKTTKFLEIQDINNILLETIINSLRNCAYNYQYNHQKQIINITIKL